MDAVFWRPRAAYDVNFASDVLRMHVSHLKRTPAVRGVKGYQLLWHRRWFHFAFPKKYAGVLAAAAAALQWWCQREQAARQETCTRVEGGEREWERRRDKERKGERGKEAVEWRKSVQCPLVLAALSLSPSFVFVPRELFHCDMSRIICMSECVCMLWCVCVCVF